MSGPSRYYEDFAEGEATPPVVRRIEAPAVATFLELLELRVPLFHDDGAAREAGYSRRIAPGPVVLSYAMASVVPSGWLNDSLIGLLRMDEVLFCAPCYVGDEVTFTNRVVFKRRSSKPERGYVTLRLTAVNQDDVVVLEFERTFVVKCRKNDQPTR
jgi:acyl dehydratase